MSLVSNLNKDEAFSLMSCESMVLDECFSGNSIEQKTNSVVNILEILMSQHECRRISQEHRGCQGN